MGMRHANILPVLGVCLDGQLPVLVTQFAERGSLADLLSNDTVWR